MIPFLKTYGISIALCLLILILCLMNTAQLPAAPMTDFDKLAHLLMFIGLSGTVFLDNTRYFRRQTSGQRLFWGSFLFPLLFSGVIEIMQEYFTANRSGDWMDFLFDGIGTTAGLLICWLINRRLKPCR